MVEYGAQCDYLIVVAVVTISVIIVVPAKTFKVLITAAGAQTLAGWSEVQNLKRKRAQEKRIIWKKDGRRKRGRVNNDGRPAS